MKVIELLKTVIDNAQRGMLSSELNKKVRSIFDKYNIMYDNISFEDAANIEVSDFLKLEKIDADFCREDFDLFYNNNTTCPLTGIELPVSVWEDQDIYWSWLVGQNTTYTSTRKERKATKDYLNKEFNFNF